MNHALDGQATASIRGDVVFVGTSAALGWTRDRALALGYGRTDSVHAAVDCAVVDDDALDGICTATEAALLAQVRALGIPVLTVREARIRFDAPAGALALA